MNKDYDKMFNAEIERILKQLYYEPMNLGVKLKRARVETEKRYVDYLEEHGLATNLDILYGDSWSLQLESKGTEVFEKYGNWATYKKKVIDSKAKVEHAKNLSQRYWWVPVIISLISIIISILVLIQKK